MTRPRSTTALRYRWAIGLSVAVALGAAACSDEDPEIAVSGDAPDPGGETAVVENGGDGGPSEVTVTAKDIAFDIGKIEVNAGRDLTVTFVNDDDGIPHNFHVDDDQIDLLTDIKPGPDTQTLDVPIDAPGTYSFICDIHPTQMTGEIVAS